MPFGGERILRGSALQLKPRQFEPGSQILSPQPTCRGERQKSTSGGRLAVDDSRDLLWGIHDGRAGFVGYIQHAGVQKYIHRSDPTQLHYSALRILL